MVRSLCLAIALVATMNVAWAEESQPRTQNTEESRACHNDAHRFCKSEIPDEFRVASCLQEHRDRISRGCRAVLEGHGM